MFFRRKEEISQKLTEFYVQNSNTLKDYLKDDMNQEHKRIIIKKIYDLLEYSTNPKIKTNIEKAENTKIKVYRGISAKNEELLKEYIEQFINGDLFLGGRASIYGSGIYTYCGSDNKVVDNYATDGNSNSTGVVIEIELPSDINIVSYDDIATIQEKIIPILRKKYNDSDNFQKYIEILSNNGVFAAILGVDAIYVEQKQYMVILNRGKMIVNDIALYQDKIYQSDINEVNYNKVI